VSDAATRYAIAARKAPKSSNNGSGATRPSRRSRVIDMFFDGSNPDVIDLKCTSSGIVRVEIATG
jgi:hypothetical protein